MESSRTYGRTPWVVRRWFGAVTVTSTVAPMGVCCQYHNASRLWPLDLFQLTVVWFWRGCNGWAGDAPGTWTLWWCSPVYSSTCTRYGTDVCNGTSDTSGAANVTAMAGTTGTGALLIVHRVLEDSLRGTRLDLVFRRDGTNVPSYGLTRLLEKRVRVGCGCMVRTQRWRQGNLSNRTADTLKAWSRWQPADPHPGASTSTNLVCSIGPTTCSNSWPNRRSCQRTRCRELWLLGRGRPVPPLCLAAGPRCCFTFKAMWNKEFVNICDLVCCV